MAGDERDDEVGPTMRPLSPECVAPSFSFLPACRRLPTAHRTTARRRRRTKHGRVEGREGHLTHSRIVFHFLHLATNKRREHRHATGRASRGPRAGANNGKKEGGREGSIRGSPPQPRESHVRQLPCLASSPLRPLPPHFNTVGAVKRWRVALARRRNLRRAAVPPPRIFSSLTASLPLPRPCRGRGPPCATRPQPTKASIMCATC